MAQNIDKAASLDRLVKHMGITREEVKEKADFVTLTNDKDGIAYALEKFLF